MKASNSRGKRLFYLWVVFCTLLAVGPCLAAPNKTTVTGILYRADGTPATGTLTISWPSFTTADQQAVAAGTLVAPIAENGLVSVELVPTAGGYPAGISYTVLLHLDDGVVAAPEYWIVPATSPAALADVRSLRVPANVAVQPVTREYVDSKLQTKAEDAAVVHNSGDETIAGVKTFSSSSGLTVAGAVRASSFVGRVVGGAFAGLMGAMKANRSTALQVVGDSTGNDTDEWVYLTAQWLAARYPGYTVRHRLWDDSAQGYAAATTIQTGTSGEQYLNFTGVQSATFPAASIPAIAGNPSVRVKLAPDSWQPAATQVLAAHFGDAGQRSWIFMLGTDGTLRWTWSTDGTAMNTAYGDTAVPVASPPAWVRVDHTLDDGAGHNLVKFYTSADGVTWTQLGGTITNAGTTTIFNASGYDWELGARTSTTLPYIGKIYRIEIFDGTKPIAMQPIDAWHIVSGSSSETMNGSPEITVYNASVTGQGLSYFADAMRSPKVLAPAWTSAFILNIGHNEGDNVGPSEMGAYGSYLSSVKSALPMADVAVLTQNPEFLPAVHVQAQAMRRTQLLGWCHQNRYPVIDIFQAFLDDGGGAALVDTDGIHPVSAGQQIWATQIENALMGSE